MSVSVEHHPEWYHAVPHMKTLILGSFPPHPDRWTYPFYYPNAQNRFWRILAHIAGEPHHPLKHFADREQAVRERKALMETLNVGVQNMGLSIRRLKGKSSLDTDIEIVEFQDILGIIRRHPELEYILLPGYSAKSSTYQSFRTYLSKHGIPTPNMPQKPQKGAFMLHMEGRDITCAVVNSTSTAARISEEDVRMQFEKYIGLEF